MKVYISADIEGITGVLDRSETTAGSTDYETARKQMTREVTSACQGAMEAGAMDIVVKDAHATGRNLLGADLPVGVRLLRGWSGHPFMMMEALDSTFDAAMLIGYHDKGGSGGNPLAHTIDSSKINTVTINGLPASEFQINTLTAGLEQVPVVLISGDQSICAEAEEMVPGIAAVPVKQGSGASVLSLHPDQACEQIQQSARQALAADPLPSALELPEFFEVQIEYLDFKDAFRAAFYPGVRSIAPKTVLFESHDYFDVLRLFLFLL